MEENELIVLDDAAQEPNRGTAADPSVASALPEWARRFRAGHVWYISPHRRGLTTEQHPGFSVSIAEPNELFPRILKLPEEYSAMVTSDVDVNGYAYKNAFQRRAAVSPLDVLPVGAEEPNELLDTELARWADSEGVESPLLLLGDRGSGKTWQLVKFCEDRYHLHRESPWLHAPAFYVPLRGVLSYLDDSQRSSLGLYGLLADRYSWFSVKWNIAMFQALLECNQIIICLDGLDEVEVQPSESAVQDHLRRIVNMVPMGARLIISSRTTHFSSFDRLYSLETWPGANVSGSFRVFELAPFRLTDLITYASAVTASEPPSVSLQRLNEILQKDRSRSELSKALQRCSRQPALLARLVNEVKTDNSVTDFELLQRAIEGSLIGFNIEFERTRPLHLDSQGELRTFDTSARIAFLGELAWFMAERHLESINLDRLPARLIRMFGLDTEALRRDIRSQTVFELVESPTSLSTQSSLTNGAGATDSEGGSASVRFGFRLEDDVRGSPSVAESYFLASHIAARIADSRYMRGVALANTLQYLGRIHLDKLTATILRQMLENGPYALDNPQRLVADATQYLVELAKKGQCRVFTRSLRFLMQNLESIGYLNAADRVRLDPWTEDLASILKFPEQLGSYEFVLVPEQCSQKIAHKAKEVGIEPATTPFLLGVHEVTNQQFAKFILSQEGSDWATERVTRASSYGSTPPSRYASRTNEYHLYFWEEVNGGRGTFMPPSAFLRHPVVYVSWYAAQAFCNWLSHVDRRTVVHSIEDIEPLAPQQSSDAPGFRLPTAAEWWWSAQGPNDRAGYPWEILPYDCVSPSRDSDADAPASKEAISAREWFGQYREAATAVLLDSGRRSAEVAYDDDVGPFGAIGLIGNVKEWVDDRIKEATSGIAKALVCGATAHLGRPSFQIGYYATLFPENTNPDVGFRIARSLATRELKALMSRETELATLS